jgi:hypothetical protein
VTVSEKRKKRSKQCKPKREREQPSSGELSPPPGRPSKYVPSCCARILELGRQGASRAQIAAALDINRDTLREWCGIHPEFSAAIKSAMDLSLAWWERIGQEHMLRPGFNATAFIFQMVNRFPADYRRDAGAAEVPVNKEGPIQSQAVAAVLVQEDRLAPMFERFYSGLKAIEHQPSKSASGNGHAKGANGE